MPGAHVSNTVEQAKFASAYISRIRDLVSHSRSYRTRSIGWLVTLSTTGGDGAIDSSNTFDFEISKTFFSVMFEHQWTFP